MGRAGGAGLRLVTLTMLAALVALVFGERSSPLERALDASLLRDRTITIATATNTRFFRQVRKSSPRTGKWLLPLLTFSP